MITRLANNELINPIRSHLQISFKLGKLPTFKQQIFDYLMEKKFNPLKSKVLIFVKSRKKAEEFSSAFNSICETENVKFKSGFFHAGMDSEDRKVAYEKFKENGPVAILFATKAFGMGMNIRNIHYLFHIQPSSTFEDFLQEVGRAGRDKKKYEEVGFSESNKIQTICLYEKDDFGKIRDLMKKSEISWSDILNVNDIVKDYIEKFQPLEENSKTAFPLPMDLLNTDPLYVERKDTSTLFRLSLHWLEKARRIRTEYFTPSFFKFSNDIIDNGVDLNKIKNEKERALVELIVKARNEKFQDCEQSLIDIKDLYKIVEKKSLSSVFKLIIKAQEKKYVKMVQEIQLKLTEFRIKEIENMGSSSGKSIRGTINISRRTTKINSDLKNKTPLIDAIFSFAKEILEGTKSYEREELSGASLDIQMKEIISNYFRVDRYEWKGKTAKKGKERAEKIEKYRLKQIEDFKSKRIKHVFWLIGLIPKIKHESLIGEGNRITHIIYNNDAKESWKIWLTNFKSDVYKFISFFKNHFKENGSNLDVIEAIVKSGISQKDIGYFGNLLAFLKKLGYVSYTGGLIPMALETYLVSLEPIGSLENDAGLQEEFKEVIRLKKLRLASLEAFASIKNDKTASDFIQEYFQCKDSGEIVNLLENYINSGNRSIISEFREEALRNRERGLSKEQRMVYDSPIDVSTSVKAGPGSGKTHTLTLRVARLIQKENINPENILVLAYNRAVVVELKERLFKLFTKLGYRTLTYSLKVFTFSGFIKYCLRDSLDEVDLKRWEDKFLSHYEHNPGLIQQRIGTIQHVFVDEFQDINYKRLSILNRIVNPDITRLTIIGDPNQSIYGFNRVDTSDPRSPTPYYEKFNELFAPVTELQLSNNYRSYPEIISKAEEILEHQDDFFDLGNLNPLKKVPEGVGAYVFERDIEEVGPHAWKEELLALVNRTDPFSQISIMVRNK